MMLVKGSALISMRSHIPKKVGKQDYERWLKSLKPDVEKVFNVNLSISKWYPLKEYLIEPSQNYCKLFYDGDLAGAWELGKFSAAYSLNGMYKIFVELSSIKFIISRAAKILPSYYKPSSLELTDIKKNSCIVKITEFPEIDKIIEYRIGGWIEYALEMHGSTDVKIDIVNKMSENDPFTEYNISWKDI